MPKTNYFAQFFVGLKTGDGLRVGVDLDGGYHLYRDGHKSESVGFYFPIDSERVGHVIDALVFVVNLISDGRVAFGEKPLVFKEFFGESGEALPAFTDIWKNEDSHPEIIINDARWTGDSGHSTEVSAELKDEWSRFAGALYVVE